MSEKTETIRERGFDYKRVVIDGYNDCADRYLASKSGTERSLSFIFDNVHEKERILDFGCGSGVPVARDLSYTYSVIGVDISEKQIELAKKNVPTAEFIHSDILDMQFENGSFSAIVSFYTLFHLPKENHRSVLEQLYAWLRPKGILLISVGNTNQPAYLEHDFHGVTMYWSHFDRSEYVRLVKEIGFTIIRKPELEYTDGERHPIIIGVK